MIIIMISLIMKLLHYADFERDSREGEWLKVSQPSVSFLTIAVSESVEECNNNNYTNY